LEERNLRVKEKKGLSLETKEQKNIFSKFEEVRIIAARAQQIAAGAPLLLKENEIPPGLSDPVELAKLEYKLGRLPVYIERE
jgi:DNA-directed RNA polymerase subunit K/omega